MDKYLIDIKKYYKEISERKKIFDYSLGGKTGFCFIEGKYIIKIYDKLKKKEDYVDLSMHKSFYISFPITYLFDKGYVIGEIMPYYNVDTIDNALNLRSNIDSFRESYYNIIKEINKFPNIIMYDLWAKNILYSSKKGFYLIDVTDWKYSSDNEINTNIINLDRALGFLINQLIFDDGKLFIDINNYYKILRKDKIGKELLEIILSFIKKNYIILELIDAYKEFIRINYNYDIKTLSDMKKYTKMMKYS